jgi:nucleoredoxin
MTATPTLEELVADVKESLQIWSSSKSKSADAKAPILALYFSSAWCDDSQASHQHVVEVIQKQQEQAEDETNCHDHLVDLVYVSSDTSSKELEGNLEEGWKFIPFQEEELRANLKRHFGVCAKKEMEGLGITSDDRKGGIPTLVLIETKNNEVRVLHPDAIPHVMGDTKKKCPLTHWRSLLEDSQSEDVSKKNKADDKLSSEEKDPKKQKVVENEEE